MGSGGGGASEPPPAAFPSPPVSPFIAPAPGQEMPGAEAPPALTWFRAFCICQVLLLGGFALVGLLMVVGAVANPPPTGSSGPPPWIIGAGIAAFYFMLCVPYLIGLAVGRQKWVWAYGIVLTILSYVCGGCWPLGIVVLIYWFKTETKAWYENA
jgi:hypothetical protein